MDGSPGKRERDQRGRPTGRLLLPPAQWAAASVGLPDTLVISTCWVKYDPFKGPPSHSALPQDDPNDGGHCRERPENMSSVKRLAIKKSTVLSWRCPEPHINPAARAVWSALAGSGRNSRLLQCPSPLQIVFLSSAFGFAARVTARGKKTPERSGCGVGEAGWPHESLMPTEATGPFRACFAL